MLHCFKIGCLFCLLLFGRGISQVIEQSRAMDYHPDKNTIKTRFQPPKGYVWERYPAGSFQKYLSEFKLKPEGLPLRDYRDLPVPHQFYHAAILDIEVGNKDLQQCADAWIRLYAEYLWEQKRYDEISFEFTSGQMMPWNDYKKGIRTTEIGDKVRFHQSAKASDTYDTFRQYLNLIFQYAGTISLDRESVPVATQKDIQVGDIIITPGSPGHAVFIVGSAKNATGKRVFLLAQSFMPAQDIHILKNPNQPSLSPWYHLDINAPKLRTAKYLFSPLVIKRFRGLVESKGN